MFILVTIIHVIVSLFLVVVVLLQSGKAADLAGAFGGMGSQTVFGPRGSATVLTRATTISAVLFMITSLSLSILSTSGPTGGGGGAGSDLLDKISAPPAPVTSTPAPGAPATPGVPGTPPGGAPTSIPATIELGGQKQEIQVPVTPKGAPATTPAAPAPAPKDAKQK